MKWYVGCSGFSYTSWKEFFYPDSIKQKEWLKYYATQFNTVELNGSFYRFPRLHALKKMYDETPGDFKFSIKAHKVITHTLRMKDAREKIIEFVQIAEAGLQDKLACILFQMPPTFKYSAENLASVLQSISANPHYIVEFRNAAWWNESVFKSFRKNHLTFCSSSHPELPQAVIKSSCVCYIRFHGIPELFASSYSKKQLIYFKEQVPSSAKECFIYFNNTMFEAAVRNAQTFKELINPAT